MALACINFAKMAADTFAATQDFANKVVADGQEVDWGQVLKEVCQGTGDVREMAKGVLGSNADEMHQVDWSELSMLVAAGAGVVSQDIKQTLVGAAAHVQSADWALLAQQAQQERVSAFEAARSAVKKVIEGRKGTKLDEVVKNWIKAHPYLTVLTAAQVVFVLLLLFPQLLTVPFFASVGLGEIGPVAGSLAAWHQSVLGTNIVFSGLQSAAMGGHGVATVDAGIRGFAVLAIAIAEVLKHVEAPELTAYAHQNAPFEDDSSAYHFCCTGDDGCGECAEIR